MGDDTIRNFGAVIAICGAIALFGGTTFSVWTFNVESKSDFGDGEFEYKFGVVPMEDIFEDDHIVENLGVKVFIDSAAVMYLLGTEMDYKKEELSSTFVFKNPNETERCGCGESFKI